MAEGELRVHFLCLTVILRQNLQIFAKFYAVLQTKATYAICYVAEPRKMNATIHVVVEYTAPKS